MTTALIATAAAFLVFVTALLKYTMKPQSEAAPEPPSAPQSLPFVGHVFGLMQNSFNYYVQLSKQMDTPIFTLSLPGQKMYIVTKPEYIQSVQKQHKILSFSVVASKFAATVCGVSKEASGILAINSGGEQGEWGLWHDSDTGMRAALKPGEGLDDMNRVMMEEINRSLDEIRPANGKTHTMQLNAWLRSVVTLATTNSVYGPENPHKDPEISGAFWEFEKGLMSILIGVLPSITARKPIAAREKVATAFEKYFSAGHHERGSILARTRYATSKKNGLSISDIAHFEVGGSLATLVNTAGAAFWMLLLVHAAPGLLADVRQEIDAVTQIDVNNKQRTVDITSLKDKCPVLVSALKESLRYRSMGTSVREVTEDTVLDGWLLKKGALLQMPSRVIHCDTNLWGSSAEEFDPRRFTKDAKQRPPNDVAFRVFGGGKTLCPGRHFATNEMLAVVALFVSRYDMKPANGAKWDVPTADNSNASAVVMEPDYDVAMEVTNRPGFEDYNWAIDLKASEKVFAVVAEDRAG